DAPLADAPLVDGLREDAPPAEAGQEALDQAETLQDIGSADGLLPLSEHVWDSNVVPTVVDGDTVHLSGTPSGTLSIPSGARVYIDGLVSPMTTGQALLFGSGSVVEWNASLTGSYNAYLVTLSGATGSPAERCSFIVGSSVSLANNGSGGTLRVNAVSIDVFLGDGSSIVSGGTTGNAVTIDTNNVSLRIGENARIASTSSNVSTAIQISTDVRGALIELNGGSVVSDSQGYAINDGGGSGLAQNDTSIVINSGEVRAGSSCAIHSTGSASTVTVNGGDIANSAGNNLNPVIYMNGGLGDNAFINGGTIRALTNNAYVLQSSGNIIVTGGEVTSINGRAINLVGLTSVATINGGIIQATGSGTAVSTATTSGEAAANAAIIVNGGLVTTTTGNAINLAGINSSVSIKGGVVAATTGNAVNVTNTATNASVSLSGGFVFAYGNTVTTSVASASYAVIRMPSGLLPNIADDALAVAWSGTAGATYLPGLSNDITFQAIGETSVQWRKVSDASGIAYQHGATQGFYPLPVNVRADSEFGLIFDADQSSPTYGQFYLDINNNQNIDTTDIAYNEGQGTAWSFNGATCVLDLTGFTWVTPAPFALVILGDLQVTLHGENTLTSTSSDSLVTCGIYCLDGSSLNLNGGGLLVATGGSASGQAGSQSIGISAYDLQITSGSLKAKGSQALPDGQSFGISAASVNMLGGSIEASADTSALGFTSAPGLLLPNSYEWLSNQSSPSKPGGLPNTYPGTPYLYDPSDMYLRLTDLDINHGLIFDASTGTMYLNKSGIATVEANLDYEFTTGRGLTWDASPGVLALSGFDWISPSAVSLYILKGDATVRLAGASTNMFVSTYEGGEPSVGILVPSPASLTIEEYDPVPGNPGKLVAVGGSSSLGSFGVVSDKCLLTGGALAASGGNSTESVGLDCQELGLSGGSLTAKGGSSDSLSLGIRCSATCRFDSGSLTASGQTGAIQALAFVNNGTTYKYSFSLDDPSGAAAGTSLFSETAPEPYDVSYQYSPDDLFVSLSTTSFALVGEATIRGTANASLPGGQALRVTLFGDTLADGGDAADWFVDLPSGVTATIDELATTGDYIVFTFAGTPAAATTSQIGLNIPSHLLAHGNEITLITNTDARFRINEPLTFIYDPSFDIPAETVDEPIAQIVVSSGVSGGEAPYRFLAEGLPAGLSIDPLTGVISGTPSASAAAGTATITVFDEFNATASISISFGEVALSPTPDEPGEPDQPDEPDEPGDPGEPGKPGQPSVPGRPGTPGNTSPKPTKRANNTPPTGDASMMVLALMTVLSLSGSFMVYQSDPNKNKRMP
ncbi:MAG: putative Ig domain-containing protein, partial [Coriobacteriia bacterium]|nr:putative Ig domain-containing protein [Coriobacteriia bacterium]